MPNERAIDSRRYGMRNGPVHAMISADDLVNATGLAVVDVRTVAVNCPRTRQTVLPLPAPRRRGSPCTEIVVHETVTVDVPSTVHVLRERGLGVHAIVDSDGVLYYFSDLADSIQWHASQHNNASFGVEVVNPVEPKYRPKSGPWSEEISAKSIPGGRYVVPTLQQCEAVTSIVRASTDGSLPGLSIPRHWIGEVADHIQFGRVRQAYTPSPGIYAHCYFGHSDGGFLVAYAWLRLAIHEEPEQAYRAAKDLMTRWSGL